MCLLGMVSDTKNVILTINDFYLLRNSERVKKYNRNRVRPFELILITASSLYKKKSLLWLPIKPSNDKTENLIRTAQIRKTNKMIFLAQVNKNK
jgi:hypothetical protein